MENEFQYDLTFKDNTHNKSGKVLLLPDDESENKSSNTNSYSLYFNKPSKRDIYFIYPISKIVNYRDVEDSKKIGIRFNAVIILFDRINTNSIEKNIKETKETNDSNDNNVCQDAEVVLFAIKDDKLEFKAFKYMLNYVGKLEKRKNLTPHDRK